MTIEDMLRKRFFDSEERLKRMRKKAELQKAEIDAMKTDIEYQDTKQELREKKAANNPLNRLFGTVGKAYTKEIDRRRLSKGSR